MYRISLFIWTCIGIIFLAIILVFPGMWLQTNVMATLVPQVTLEEVRVTEGNTVPGGRVTLTATVTGDPALVRSVYADLRGVGGARVDLRHEQGNTYSRANISLGKTIATGTYTIPVRVVLYNNTQREETLTISITERLRGVAEETPVATIPIQEQTQAQEVIVEELSYIPQPVVYVAGEETIHIVLPTPVHPNAIMSSGEQFGIHRFDNYFSTVPIQRAALNSSGEIITLTTKGLVKGVHYTISVPTMPLKALFGEEDVQLPTSLVFEYRTYATGQLQIHTAVQKTHNSVEVTFNRPLDMQTLIQEESICQLRTKAMSRMVGQVQDVEVRSATLLRLVMDRGIPTGDLELWCSGLRGVFGTNAVARVLKAPVQISPLPADQRQMIFRSDFTGDGIINEEDLQLLLNAIAGK